MPSNSSTSAFLSPWTIAIVSGVLASAGYTAVVYGYLLSPFSQLSVSGALHNRVWWDLLLSLGTIGLPVVLYLRYRVRSPLLLLMAILLFWHGLIVHIPGTETMDTAAFAFVFMLAPAYVAGYLLFAHTEQVLRGRRRSEHYGGISE